MTTKSAPGSRRFWRSKTTGNGTRAPGSPSAPSRYAPLWSPSNERDARLAIYTNDDEANFEEGGQHDFETLSPYIDQSSTVLDLGCGIGRVARYVAPNCARLWAVDVSQQMLDMAANRMRDCPNVSYTLCADVTFPDVPSESVDVAYSLLVLQHCEREDAFLLLEELRRVLRPQGRLIVTYPNLLSDTYLESFLSYAHSGASTEPARARMYTPQEVERIMPAAGFEVEITAATEIWAFARKL